MSKEYIFGSKIHASEIKSYVYEEDIDALANGVFTNPDVIIVKRSRGTCYYYEKGSPAYEAIISNPEWKEIKPWEKTSFDEINQHMIDFAIGHHVNNDIGEVDGNHYGKLKMQPIEYIDANDLDFDSGNVVKYISRFKYKNGQRDIVKAIHYCLLEIKHVYGTLNYTDIFKIIALIKSCLNDNDKK